MESENKSLEDMITEETLYLLPLELMVKYAEILKNKKEKENKDVQQTNDTGNI